MHLHRITLVKIGILLAGVALIAYSAYLRSFVLGSDESLPAILGLLLIIIGIISFFIGGEEEHDIPEEELERQS